MAEQCWKCGGAIRWDWRFGAFCPDPSCDVLDDLEPHAPHAVAAATPAPDAAPRPEPPMPEPRATRH